MFYALLAIAGVVGFFIGAVGIGGILLIPALNLLAGLSIHEASATALFTFFFTGLVGTYAFHRHGSINWKIAAPVCAGAVAFGFLGAKVNWIVDARVLNLVVALLIVFAGAYIFVPKRALGSERDGRAPSQQLMLLGVGCPPQKLDRAHWLDRHARGCGMMGRDRLRQNRSAVAR